MSNTLTKTEHSTTQTEQAPVGTLYLNPETGEAYRLTMYITDFDAVYSKRRESELAGIELSDEDVRKLAEATPQLPRYGSYSLNGGAGSIDALPENAIVTWTPSA
jgi:hypothetical protein